MSILIAWLYMCGAGLVLQAIWVLICLSAKGE